MPNDNQPGPVVFSWIWPFGSPKAPAFLPQPVKLACRVRSESNVTFYEAGFENDTLTARTTGTAQQLKAVKDFEFGWICQSAFLPLYHDPMQYEPPLPA